jgi:hypothetical protein
MFRSGNLGSRLFDIVTKVVVGDPVHIGVAVLHIEK